MRQRQPRHAGSHHGNQPVYHDRLPKIAAEGHKALREAGIGVIEHMCRWSRAYPLTSRGSAGYLA